MRTPRIAAAAAGLLLVVGCKTAPSTAAAIPDCSPSNVQALLSCWWPGEGLAVTQCEVKNESPVGCGFGERALLAYENVQSLPLLNSAHPNGTWVGIPARQDAEGRIGIRQHHRDGRVSLQITPATKLAGD